MTRKTDIWEKATAFYLSNKQVETLLSHRLEQVIGRKITTKLFSDNGYWDIHLKPQLVKSELETVFSYIKASNEVRADHKPRKGAVGDISDILAIQLVSADFPLPIHSSVPLENGVWFFTNTEPCEKRYPHQANGTIS